MAAIKFNGFERVFQRMDGLQAFLKNPSKTLKEIGDFGVEEVTKQFDTEGTRLSTQWKKLKESTRIEKARAGYGGKRILERTGTLKNSTAKDVNKTSVRIYNKAKYAEYHQLGMGNNPVRKIFDTPENFKGNVIELINKGIRSAIK